MKKWHAVYMGYFMNNKERGDKFGEQVKQYLEKQGYTIKSEYSAPVGLNSRHKKAHDFDYGNEKLLVECKFYDWTEGGNKPSAKISILNEAMMYFYSAPAHFKKMLFIARTKQNGIKNPETLAEYYWRLYKHFVPDDVEIWEFDLESRQVKLLNG